MERLLSVLSFHCFCRGLSLGPSGHIRQLTLACNACTHICTWLKTFKKDSIYCAASKRLTGAFLAFILYGTFTCIKHMMAKGFHQIFLRWINGAAGMASYLPFWQPTSPTSSPSTQYREYWEINNALKLYACIPVIPALGRRKDQEFKIILSYTKRPPWAPWDPVLKTKQF